jgi:hypothetical protein
LGGANAGISVASGERKNSLLAVLTDAQFILHGWLRRVRADSGFFGQSLLEFLEQRGLTYIVVARLTADATRTRPRQRSWPFGIRQVSNPCIE